MPIVATGRHPMSTATYASTDTARTQPIRQAFNDRSVKAASAPALGSKIIYDPRSAGFGVRVTSSGAKSFVLNYRFKGRERRITIGHYPAWTLLAARKQADHFRREIDTGIDPLEKRTSERVAPTSVTCSRDTLPNTSRPRLHGLPQMIGQCGSKTSCRSSVLRRCLI